MRNYLQRVIYEEFFTVLRHVLVTLIVLTLDRRISNDDKPDTLASLLTGDPSLWFTEI